MNDSSPVLTLNNVSKKFGDLCILQDISFAIRRGSRVGLIGPNGAGKTTLVNILLGKHLLHQGSIVLNGKGIHRLSTEQRVKQGLSQSHQITSLFNEETVIENLVLALCERDGTAWGIFNYGEQSTRHHEEARESLREIGLEDYTYQRVTELSYGQQRLLEIAMAMVLRPSVLILDEPGAGISSAEVEIIINAIRKLPESVTILIIEHDMEVIRKCVDEVMVMVEGRIVLRGNTNDVLADKYVERIYLGRD